MKSLHIINEYVNEYVIVCKTILKYLKRNITEYFFFDGLIKVMRRHLQHSVNVTFFLLVKKNTVFHANF
jgi:hypothetical protein